jgi:hypothetical protein
MDTYFSNSFYYFFSAIPQVLGAILALFGVFSVFKVQSVKDQIIGIAKTISKNSRTTPIITGRYTEGNQQRTRTMSYSLIDEKIEKNDIKGLYELFKDKSPEGYGNYFQNITKHYEELKSFISQIQNASIFTGITILVTLATLPFGFVFLAQIWLLYILFFIIICGIGYSLFLFIKILKMSFEV